MPIVTEIARRVEPVTRDPFIDDLSEPLNSPILFKAPDEATDDERMQRLGSVEMN